MFGDAWRCPQWPKSPLFITLKPFKRHLFNAFIGFTLVSYFPHHGFVHICSCLVHIFCRLILCILISTQFCDKIVLIVVYKSLNVNIRCSQRYIGWFVFRPVSIVTLKTVFASISSTRFCKNNRIWKCSLSIDGSINKVLALRVCLVA